jgi:hypothetical protein
LSDDMYIIQRATAEAYLAGKSAPSAVIVSAIPQTPTDETSGSPKPTPPTTAPIGVNRVTWQGDVPPQKWMNFYTKVLSKFCHTDWSEDRFER